MTAAVVNVLPADSDLTAMAGAPPGTALELRSIHPERPVLLLTCPGCGELMTVAENAGPKHFPTRFAVVGHLLSIAGALTHRCGLVFTIQASKVAVGGRPA